MYKQRQWQQVFIISNIYLWSCFLKYIFKKSAREDKAKTGSYFGSNILKSCACVFGLSPQVVQSWHSPSPSFYLLSGQRCLTPNALSTLSSFSSPSQYFVKCLCDILFAQFIIRAFAGFFCKKFYVFLCMIYWVKRYFISQITSSLRLSCTLLMTAL